MNILALDLGAKTGWHVIINESQIGGTLVFEGTRHDRLRRFYTWLHTELDLLYHHNTIDVVTYERPFSRGMDATRSLWGMAGIVEGVGSKYAAVLDVPLQSIKKWAGKGGTKKDWTMKKAIELYGPEPVDDNHADAIVLAHYVKEFMQTIKE